MRPTSLETSRLEREGFQPTTQLLILEHLRSLGRISKSGLFLKPLGKRQALLETRGFCLGRLRTVKSLPGKRILQGLVEVLGGMRL